MKRRPIATTTTEGSTIVKHPDKRLFFHPDAIVAVGHAGQLPRAGHGPVSTMLRAALVSVPALDLTLHPGDEAVAEPVGEGVLSAPVRERLETWAGLVGLSRLWLPREVVEIDVAAIDLGVARVRCLVCTAEFEDGGIDFWANVRTYKGFPIICLCCSSHLPQWDNVVSHDRHIVSEASRAGA